MRICPSNCLFWLFFGKKRGLDCYNSKLKQGWYKYDENFYYSSDYGGNEQS
jgi:hypothetical protein